MGKLGKVFGVLVLLLSLAVAVLSWKLSEQRVLFRSHSEALAQGLVQVASAVASGEGVDVSEDLSKVTYKKAPEGGKESGTLGFEDFRQNPKSVSSSVSSLVAALEKRQAQSAAMAVALAETGKAMSMPESAGVTKENLLTGSDYQQKLDLFKGRATLISARDEALRSQLEQTARKLGISTEEFRRDTFNQMRRDPRARGGFAVTGVFGEFDTLLRLYNEQQRLINDSLKRFSVAMENHEMSFRSEEVSSVSSRFATTSKSSRTDDERARKEYLGELKKVLEVFVSDARSLNKHLADMKKKVQDAEGQVEDLRATAERAEGEAKDMQDKISQLQESNRKLTGEIQWAKKNLEELSQAKNLNKAPVDPLAGKILKELAEVKLDFFCYISHVEPQEKFVILSGNNRKLCPGTRLIALHRQEDGKVIPSVRMEVRKCTDFQSLAYVISGDVGLVKVGDRVELSVEHQSMVSEVAEERKSLEEAGRREENRKRLERHRARESEKQQSEAPGLLDI